MSQDLRIKLCKPDRTTIHILNEAINPVYTQVYSGINTFDFDIPCYLSDSNTGLQSKNPTVDLIKQYYLLFYNNEYFIIDFINKVSDEENDILQISSYGLGYQLANKRIRNLTTGTTSNVVKNLTNTSDLILSNTGWSTGSVDVNLDLLYRAIDVSDASVLESVNSICETWDCIPKYNTINRTIDFVDYRTDGIFRGLTISKSRYLKNISYEKLTDLITKLHVYGVDDISINAVNPNGQNYITDYTYVKTTDYMSQTMINHLNSFEGALSTQSSTLTGYLTTKKGYQSTLATKNNELDILLNEETYGLNNINLRIDVAVANGTSQTALKAELADRQALVDTKNSEINAVKAQIAAVDVQIASLQSSLAISNYLTTEEISLLNDLTFESSYVDSTITTKGTTIAILQELLEEAQKQLAILSVPRFSATLDIIDFCSCEETSYDKDKLKLGDIVKVFNPDLDMYLDAKITEISQDFDNFGLDIKISNTKDIKQGFTKSQSLLKSVSGISGTISVNANSWDNGGKAGTIINEYIGNSIDTTKQTINSGVNNSVQTNSRGITIIDPTEPQYVQRFTAGAWGLSSDGGNTWKVGASKGNIHAETITGNLIVGNTGIFQSLKLYDDNDVLVGEIGKYISSEDGLEHTGIQITGGALEIIGGSSTTDTNAVHLGDSYNGVVIDSINGLKITNTNLKLRTIMNATDGFKIQQSTDGGTTWNNVLYFDTNGNGTFKGVINATDFQIDGTSVLTAEGLIDAQYISGDFGIVKDLIVDEFSTSDKIKNYLNSNTADVNYVHIYDQHMDFVTEHYVGGSTQLVSSGHTMFWTDETHTSSTITDTGFPIYVYNYSALTKSSMKFESVDGVYQPVINLGAGDANGYSKARIYKGTTGLYLEYISSTGTPRILKLTDDGIDFSEFTNVTFSEGTIVTGVSHIYIQPDSPGNAVTPDTDIWIDTDDDSTYEVLAITTDSTIKPVDPEVIYVSGTVTLTIDDSRFAQTNGIIKKIYNIGTGIVTIISSPMLGKNISGNMLLYPNEDIEIISYTA